MLRPIVPLPSWPPARRAALSHRPGAADGCALRRQDRRLISSHLGNPVRAAIFAVLHGFPVETGAVEPILTVTQVSGLPPGRSADRHDRTECSRRTAYLPSLPRPWPAGQATDRHRPARYLRCTWHRPHVDLPCDRAQDSAAITQRPVPPPRPDRPIADPSRQRIGRRAVLGGLIYAYERAA